MFPKHSYFKQFINSQFTPQPNEPEDLDLHGQTGIVTGGNGELGFECARTLLKHQLSRLILTVRNARKGEGLVDRLKKSHPEARIEIWSLSMGSYDSIRDFAQRCTALDRIDFVILNAGMAQLEFKINASTHHEELFQINYLSTALLALLLLPILKERHPKGAPGRLSMVGSGLAFTAKFPEQRAENIIQAMDDGSNWSMAVAGDRYATTKLLLLLFLVKLVEFVDPDDVVVNVVDPGYMRTLGLDRNMPLYMKPIGILMRLLFGRSLQAGAWAFVDGLLVQPRESHGNFVYNWTVSSFPAMMHTPEGKQVGERLWLETIAELEFAGVINVLSSM